MSCSHKQFVPSAVTVSPFLLFLRQHSTLLSCQWQRHCAMPGSGIAPALSEEPGLLYSGDTVILSISLAPTFTSWMTNWVRSDND